MHDHIVEMLECPACHDELTWTIAERREGRVETAEAHCRACAAIYPVRGGIGVFLTPDLQRDDLWEQMDSWLTKYLREHPEGERQLMETPLETLAPADQSYRAGLLAERGDYAQAKTVGELAWSKLYTPEYVACSKDRMDFTIECLATAGGPIVDLASGRGSLVQEMARRLSQPIIATDFSPTVLRRDRHQWDFSGLYDRVSLLALDARRTPFKDGAVETLTTYTGLPNIEQPGGLLQELRRVVSGTFLAVTHFYPENDDANAEKIRESQRETLLFRTKALECFSAAGWQVEVPYSRPVKASPTPPSVLLGGAGIDGMPVTDTVLDFCVLLARGGD